MELLYAEVGHVSSILWWDYCTRVEQRESVGGGYVDPENPEYMYAETYLLEGGFETKESDEIAAHIERVKDEGLR